MVQSKQFRKKLLYLKTPSGTCSYRVDQTSMFWADDWTGIVHIKLFTFFEAEKAISWLFKKIWNRSYASFALGFCPSK